MVAHVKHGCVPSYFPMVDMRGFTLWFNFNVKIGTNILTVSKSHHLWRVRLKKNVDRLNKVGLFSENQSTNLLLIIGKAKVLVGEI